MKENLIEKSIEKHIKMQVKISLGLYEVEITILARKILAKMF